ncbi:4114_t:CDS:2 [Ambispora leptoticha]|uniref:4114_t:CDS:1 n=1 Tax=Ambispora leptoticha TaxID=144679 RepID=A0A9N8VGI6_9GLOM|nr:4114_t:CDS:2 [Ambispora leptoticha]
MSVPKQKTTERVSASSSRNRDGQFNHAHLRDTKHLEFLDKWGSDRLPNDEIAVPLKYQPSSSDDNDDANLIAEQLQTARKWNDLALNFLNDEHQRQTNTHGHHQHHPQQIH